MVLKSLQDYFKFKFYDYMFDINDNYTIEIGITTTDYLQYLEMDEWIRNNIKGKVTDFYSPGNNKEYFRFSRKHEAAYFKLIWGGK